MRRAFLFVLMISLFLMSGCASGTGNWELVDIIQEELQTAGMLTMQARVCTADYEYTLQCVGGGEEYTVVVIEPEIIAGVTATVQSEDLVLSYDGVQLSAGELNSDGLNPVSALPCIADALTNGLQTLVWREEMLGIECVVSQFRVSDETVLTVWLDPELHAPVYAELDNGGKVVVSCTYDTWIRG